MIAVNPNPDIGATFRPPAVALYVSRVSVNEDTDEPEWMQSEPLAGWEPLVCRWGQAGTVSTLGLRPALGIGPDQAAQLQADDRNLFTTGDRIELVHTATGQELFRGWIAQSEFLIQSEPQAESLSVTAYGPEIRLQAQPVLGMWFKTPAFDDSDVAGTLTAHNSARSGVFQEYGPVIFNPDGRPNATTGGWLLSTHDDPWVADQADTGSDTYRSCRVFEPPDRRVSSDMAGLLVALQAIAWNAYQALRSLVEYIDNYTVVSYGTNWAHIQELLSQHTLRNVDVTGMNLLEAMNAILRPLGYGFYLEPWASVDIDGEARHRLHVYSLVAPFTLRKPRMAARGAVITDADSMLADVQRIHFVRDSHNVRNAVTVIGDNRRKEYTFYWRPALAGWKDLVPMWNTATAWSPDYDTITTTAADHHPFRSWIFNEDGVLLYALSKGVPATVACFNLGDTGANHVRRPRPPGPRLTWGGMATGTLPVKLDIGLYDDAGDLIASSWTPVPNAAWKLRKDRVGFSIVKNKLTEWHPWKDNEALGATYRAQAYSTLLVATLAGTGSLWLGFRLICTVPCDQRCVGTADRQASSAWPFVSRQVVYNPRRWVWFDTYSGAGNRLTRDDSAIATADAGRLCDTMEDSLGHGSLILRGIRQDYPPGVGIPETMGGRVVQLYVDSGDGTRVPVVSGVTWQFGAAVNKTELLLDTPMLRML